MSKEAKRPRAKTVTGFGEIVEIFGHCIRVTQADGEVRMFYHPDELFKYLSLRHTMSGTWAG